MLDIDLIRSRLGTASWVVLDSDGVPASFDMAEFEDGAAMIVAPVTDALKRVGRTGLIEESLDRGDMWELRGLALSRGILDSLGGGQLTPSQLVAEVEGLGESWDLLEVTTRD